MKSLGIINVGFDITDKLPQIFCIRQIPEKFWITVGQYISYS
jgi:hypothetical protein